jgi:hypothetical protein
MAEFQLGRGGRAVHRELVSKVAEIDLSAEVSCILALFDARLDITEQRGMAEKYYL